MNTSKRALFITGDSLSNTQLYIAYTPTDASRIAIYLNPNTDLSICQHTFSKDKLLRWLETQKEPDQNVCPLCEFSETTITSPLYTEVDRQEYIARMEICNNESIFHSQTAEFVFSTFATQFNFRNGIERSITVVRDDQLCGGTKSRFLFKVLTSEQFKRYREYIYVSSPYGGAQIALLIAVRQINYMKRGGIPKRAVLFIKHKKSSAPFVLVANQISKLMNPQWVEIHYDDDPHGAAQQYERERTTDRILLRSGFDYEESVQEISVLANRVLESKGQFDEVWAAVGSGTLIRGLQKSNGLGKQYFGVAVTGALPPIGNAQAITHTQPFEEPVTDDAKPDFLSASRYDAKVWQYVRERKAQRILFWNVM